MKEYKKKILVGFEKRNFELIDIAINLEWWLEDRWTLNKLSSNGLKNQIIVNFLVDKSWENGTKLVDKVLVSNSNMKNYDDFNPSKSILLDMKKGNFESKFELFWKEFEKLYN